MKKNILIFLSCFLFFLLPWYYADSGQPQPVDILILMLFTTFVLMKLPNLSLILKSRLFTTYLAFTYYSIIAMLLIYILNANDETLSLLIYNIYYAIMLTNFLLMMVYFYQACSPQKFYRLILWFLLFDLIIPTIFMLKDGVSINRMDLSFNNANQLGFFVLVNFALFIYITLFARDNRINTNKFFSLIIINVNLFFLFFALSRACTPVLLLYILSYPLIYNIKLKDYTKWYWIVSVLIIVSMGAFIGEQLYLRMSTSRLSNMSTNYIGLASDFSFRAFEGISNDFDNISSFIFGTGIERRANNTWSLEFHNNFTSIFHQIGIIGFLLYSFMNGLILFELYKKGVFYLLPFSCYLFFSMLHYSYRARVNWLMLAVIMFIVLYDKILIQNKSAAKEIS